MYQAVLPGEYVPNPRAWEWRLLGDATEADKWGLACYVGKDTLEAAKIMLDGDMISRVELGADYSVVGEAIFVEGRNGPFVELSAAMAAVEALLKLERAWPYQG